MSRVTSLVSRSPARISGAASLLALAWLWAGGIATASAAGFGAAAWVSTWDPTINEQPGEFFAVDPAASLFSSSSE